MNHPLLPRTLVPALIFLAALSSGRPAAAAPAEFALNFSRLKNLPHELRVVPEGPSGEKCLRVAVGENSRGDYHMVDLPFDLTAFRDHEIVLSYDMKLEEITPPTVPHGGIKAQIHWTSPSEGPRWFNADHPTGTASWQKQQLLIRVDPDARNGRLQLGLQGSQGKLWLANIRVQILRPRPTHQAQRFRGHDQERLRGLVAAGVRQSGDLAEMRRWGANVVRWRLLNPRWARTAIPSDPATYEPWLESAMKDLAQTLEEADKLGLRVLVDLHSPPGGRLPDGTLRMVLDRFLGQYFIDIWTRIARRFRDSPALFAYDIMNEPVQKQPSPPGTMDWWELQEAAARAVRHEDPQTPVLIASDDWNSPAAFAWMRPVEIPRVIYSVHVYWPYDYSHQGLEGEWDPATAISYPGTFLDRPLDRAALVRHLEPVRHFQEAYNAHIFVGEFSVVRYAPGAPQYLADALSLFEEYGWDWTYHAFRESTEWNLEHADLPKNPGTPSPPNAPSTRLQIIKEHLSRNR